MLRNLVLWLFFARLLLAPFVSHKLFDLRWLVSFCFVSSSFFLCFAAAPLSKLLDALNLCIVIFGCYFIFYFFRGGGDRSVFSLHLSFAECESSVMFFFFYLCAKEKRKVSSSVSGVTFLF